MDNDRRTYSGKMIDVMLSEAVLPDGRKVELEKVIHPGAALVVPFYKGMIGFLWQYRPVIEEYIWELPAGKLSPGEPPVVCAERELREETGLIAGSMEELGFIYTTPGFTDERIYIFRADCSEKTEPDTEDDELIEVRFLDTDAAKRLFARGEIKDSKTIAGLALSGVL